MNCRECQEMLQRCLNGDVAANACVADHLNTCSECAALFAAARRLQQGLRLLPAPPLPPGFAGRITVQVLAQRQARLRLRWRRTAAVAAVAASVLLTVWLLPSTTPQRHADEPVALGTSKKTVPPAPVKGATNPPPPAPEPVQHARGALDQLLERLWAMTREQADVWRDLTAPLEVAGLDLKPKPSPAPPKVDQPRPGMAIGLKTVAAVTKRGLSFMFNETPALQPEPSKPSAAPPHKKLPEGPHKSVKDS
jgi:hypothetical protein